MSIWYESEESDFVCIPSSIQHDKLQYLYDCVQNECDNITVVAYLHRIICFSQYLIFAFNWL